MPSESKECKQNRAQWGGRGGLPSCAAETACFEAVGVLVVGFWEKACAALLALAALVATPPTTPGKAELWTALELAVDELGVTELGVCDGRRHWCG